VASDGRKIDFRLVNEGGLPTTPKPQARGDARDHGAPVGGERFATPESSRPVPNKAEKRKRTGNKDVGRSKGAAENAGSTSKKSTRKRR
jgi:hypothetical protein